MSANPDLSGLFSSEFTVPPPYTLAKYFAQVDPLFVEVFKAHGACDPSGIRESIDQYAAPGTALRTFFLPLADGDRWVVSITLGKDGKLMSLQGPGESGFVIASPAYLRFRDLAVVTRDGTRLRTLVFAANGEFNSPKPVVLIRTPYFQIQGRFQDAHWFRTAQYWMQQGYNVVLQAIRGTGGSSGEFKFFSPQEIGDARDTLNWIQKQGFSNGKVGVVGTSYEGFTTLAAAITNHPSLKVVIAGGAPTRNSQGPFTRNGPMWTEPLGYMKYYIAQTGLVDDPSFNRLLLGPKFIGNLDLRTYAKLLYQGKFPPKIFDQIQAEWMNFAKSFPDVRAPYWNQREILSRVREIRVPTYDVGGIGGMGGMHGDCCGGDSLNNFLAANAGKNWKFAHLILGNWVHGDSTPYEDGGNLHPLTTYQHGLNAIMAHYLKGTPLPFPDSRVAVQSNFGDRIASGAVIPRVILSKGWPIAGLKKRELYFHQKGSASFLDASPVTDRLESETSSYTADPTKLNLINFNLFPSGVDPAQNLVFNFKVTKEVPILGDLSMDLYVRVDAPQADIIAIPVQIRPDPNGGPPQKSILTMCKLVGRAGGNRIVHLRTGSCPTMADLKPGDTLSVLISSNLYPIYARNTNNAPGPNYYDLPPRKATVALLHSTRYPSRINFSIEPQGLAKPVLPQP